MNRPRALPPGGTIGIVAPSSPAKPESLRRGVAVLRRFGYRIKLFCRPGLTDGYLAGPDALRARLFNAAFADRSVDAVLCERGGYGALRMLDGVDFGILRRNPKIFVGFSDITILHLAIWQRLKLVTFYGPMVAFPGPRYNWDHLRGVLSAPAPYGPVPPPASMPHRFLRPGRGTGRVFGGTLSLISKLVGTRWLPPLKGSILFLEDVDELPYKLDGYLAHLRHAGVFDGLAGLILANFKRCGQPRRKRRGLSLDRIWRDYFGKAPYPVGLNFPFGHQDPMFTLPLGIRATLDSRRGLILEEPAVA